MGFEWQFGTQVESWKATGEPDRRRGDRRQRRKCLQECSRKVA